ncbi:MAG: hypothetical protein HYU66_17820 [Armatimonadetes bacterium]|nr:hypothetical protein [Armatimonadota bacterium]
MLPLAAIFGILGIVSAVQEARGDPHRILKYRGMEESALGHLALAWRDCGVPAEYHDRDPQTAAVVQDEIRRRVHAGTLEVNVTDSAISLADPAEPGTARTGISRAEEERPGDRLSGLDGEAPEGRDDVRRG